MRRGGQGDDLLTYGTVASAAIGNALVRGKVVAVYEAEKRRRRDEHEVEEGYLTPVLSRGGEGLIAKYGRDMMTTMDCCCWHRYVIEYKDSIWNKSYV